jgi:polyhydroxybutyrate depolymerase
MRNKILTAGLFFLIGFHCIAQAGVTIIDSIPSNGIFRKFRLYVPSVYTGGIAVPLIINMHGYTSNALQQQAYSNFMPLADTANFLIVHPEGTNGVGGQFWNAGIAGVPDDVMFLKDLIDSLSFIYNINADRVYSCGMSNGGIMSYYLACYLPGKIAAIASVAGSMFNAWYSCAPVRPFPVMEIHGTMDGTVNYLGDATFAPIDSVVKKWRVYNNCNPAPITYSVPDINNTDNSTAINYKYTGGNNGADVELYKVIGGSHSWPGALPVIGNTNEDFSATAEIWRFFRKYKISQFVTGIENKEQALNKIKIYPNPSSEIMTIEGIENAQLSVFSLDGKKVLEVNKTTIINLKDLNPGMYFLEIKNQDAAKTIKIVRD